MRVGKVLKCILRKYCVRLVQGRAQLRSHANTEVNLRVSYMAGNSWPAERTDENR